MGGKCRRACACASPCCHGARSTGHRLYRTFRLWDIWYMYVEYRHCTGSGVSQSKFEALSWKRADGACNADFYLMGKQKPQWVHVRARERKRQTERERVVRVRRGRWRGLATPWLEFRYGHLALAIYMRLAQCQCQNKATTKNICIYGKINPTSFMLIYALLKAARGT